MLTPDFQQLYEANDFVLQQYAGYFWQTGQFMGGGNKWTDAPNFMAGVSLLGPAVYGWQGYTSQVPLTPVAAGPSGWTPSSGDVSFASTAVVFGGGGQTYGNPAPFKLQDILRYKSLPLSEVVGPALHITGPAGTLLDLTNTPSAVGPGGYAQSPLPTTTAGTQSAAASTQSSSAPGSLMNVPAQGQAKAMQVQGEPAGGNQSGGQPTQQQNKETPPANETEVADSAASETSDASNSRAVSATAVIVFLLKSPERAKTPVNVENRSAGEPEIVEGGQQPPESGALSDEDAARRLWEQGQLDKATISEEEFLKTPAAAYSWMSADGQKAMKGIAPTDFTPTGNNIVDVPVSFLGNVLFGVGRGIVISVESIGFYVGAGSEVVTTADQRDQLGAAWKATRSDPLAETILKRAKDEGNSNPSATRLTTLGLLEVAVPINPLADALAGYDRLQERPIEGFEQAEKILVTGSQVTGAMAGGLRMTGGTLQAGGVLPANRAPFTLRVPSLPARLGAARIAAALPVAAEQDASALAGVKRQLTLFEMENNPPQLQLALVEIAENPAAAQAALPQASGGLRQLELFVEPVDRGAWGLADTLKRGIILEQKLGKNTPFAFAYIDEWQPGSGLAVSIKTTELAGRNSVSLLSGLRGWVRDIAEFKPVVNQKGFIEGQGVRIIIVDIKQRALRVGIEPGIATAEQLSIFEKVKAYGAERGLVFVEFIEVK
ncbi:MAG TPA: hypothetical protein VJ783_15315 [Pirellulales bacterium]|nr:hypothetical protein [Pirellulales bacterium]